MNILNFSNSWACLSSFYYSGCIYTCFGVWLFKVTPYFKFTSFWIYFCRKLNGLSLTASSKWSGAKCAYRIVIFMSVWPNLGNEDRYAPLHKKWFWVRGKRTSESSPAIHRWGVSRRKILKSVKRTADFEIAVNPEQTVSYGSFVRFTD